MIEDEEEKQSLREIFNFGPEIEFFQVRSLLSIDLLELLLNSSYPHNNVISELIIKIRKVRKTRNMVHIVHETSYDKAEKVFQEIGIQEYPINNYENAWNILLEYFITVLQELEKVLREIKALR